jgi:hypothetical protein
MTDNHNRTENLTMTHSEKVRSLAIVLAALDDADEAFDWQAPRYMTLAEYAIERLEHPAADLRVYEYGSLQGRPVDVPSMRALDRILSVVLNVKPRPRLRSIPVGEGDTLAAGGMRAEDAEPWRDDPPMW